MTWSGYAEARVVGVQAIASTTQVWQVSKWLCVMNLDIVSPLLSTFLPIMPNCPCYPSSTPKPYFQINSPSSKHRCRSTQSWQLGLRASKIPIQPQQLACQSNVRKAGLINNKSHLGHGPPPNRGSTLWMTYGTPNHILGHLTTLKRALKFIIFVQYLG